MMKTKLLWILLLVSCTNLPEPKNPPTGEFCAAAEKRLLELQCRIEGKVLGSPNTRGESYLTICLRVEKEAQVDMRSRCLAEAVDCEEVRSCNIR